MLGLSEKRILTKSFLLSSGGFFLFFCLLTCPVFGIGLDAQSPTANSVTLIWTAPGDDGDSGTASEYDIRYSLSGITEANWDSAVQVTGEPSPQPPGSAETFMVTGLQPGTTYYFAIRTSDEVPNWSTLSNVVGKTTVPEAPLLVSPTDGAVNLDQPVLFDWQDVSSAIQYEIQVDDTTSFDSPDVDVTTSASQYGTSGLGHGLWYYWRARARNDGGWSDWSSVRTFATRDTLLPSAVANLSASPGENNGEVLLTWTAPGDDGTSGTASQYDVRYSITDITPLNWSDASQAANEPDPQLAGSPESFIVTSLDPAVRYYFAVKATDEAGNWSRLSNVANATPTDKIPPAAIEDLSAESGSNEGEISLNWTAPGDDGTKGMVSAYLLKYSMEMITTENWDEATIYEEFIDPLVAGEKQSVIMTGLEPGGEHYVTIKACDESANFSELSNVESCAAGTGFSLDVDEGQVEPLAPVANAVLHSSRPTLSVKNIGPHSGNVYYFEVAADSHFINVVAASPSIPQSGGDITSWKIDTSLTSKRTYYWRTKANDDEYSAISSFSMNPTAHAYPNPFNMASVSEVTFTEIPAGSNLIVMTVSGATIRQWADITDYELAWDGTNESGSTVASGTYLWFIENSDIKGKIVIIR